ncbi:hypothetical protein ES708_32805 [subsurface metagenome]
MKVIQLDERTFKVYLNDAELDDITHEAVYSQISTLDVMKAIFLMTFVQVMSCRYWRRTLGSYKSENPHDKRG